MYLSYKISWNSLGEYVLSLFKEEWPYFHSDNVVRFSNVISIPYDKYPEETHRIELIRLIDKYISLQPFISVSPFVKKYPNLYNDYKKFNELGVNVKFDFNLYSFVYSANTKILMQDINVFTDLFSTHFKKQYDEIMKVLDLIKVFAQEESKNIYTRETFNCFLEEFEIFQKKYKPIMDKEIENIKSAMKNVLENRIWVNGKLNLEYKSYV